MTNTPSAAERRWPGLRKARLERAIHKRVLAGGFSRSKSSVVPEATAPAPRVRGGQSRLAVVAAALGLWWSFLRSMFTKVIR